MAVKNLKGLDDVTRGEGRFLSLEDEFSKGCRGDYNGSLVPELKGENGTVESCEISEGFMWFTCEAEEIAEDGKWEGPGR